MNVIKPLDPHVVNILSVYAMSDATDKRQGMCAYENYHRIMHDLTVKYCGQPDMFVMQKVCVVFAALSPNATYASNLSSTESMLSAWKKGKTINTVKVSTYSANKIKAWKILTMEPALIGMEYIRSGKWTTGKKTFSFYQNIFLPDGLWQGVVVDGHIYSVWMLKHFGMREAQVGNGKQYDRISNDVIKASLIAGIRPSQMQAVCWFTWKRVNRISYDVRELQHRLWIED